MADLDQDSPEAQQFQQGVALASKLPPKHVASLLQQVIQGGIRSNADGSVGTAATDPGPADADMAAIGQKPAAWVGMAAGAPARDLASGSSRRTTTLATAPSHVNYGQINPSLDNQNEDVSKLRDIADQVQNAPQKTNLSALAAYVDHISGTNFAKDYQAPLTADQKAVEAAKLRSMAAGAQNNITRDQIQSLVAQARNEGAMTRMLATQDGKTAKASGDEDKWISTDLQKAAVGLNSYLNKRDAVSQIAGTKVRAGRLSTLMSAYDKDPDSMPDTLVREMATGMASLVGSGNGGVGQGQIDELTPYGMPKDFAHAQSYVSGLPRGAQLGQWVKLMKGTVDRESKTSDLQLHALRQRELGGFQRLYDSDKGREGLMNIAQGNGISEDEVHDAFNRKAASRQGKFEELPFAGADLTRPAAVPQAIWDQLSDGGKQAAIDKVK